MGVALPEDTLAEILRRLPLRSLATSRCVCKAWRAIVDGRRLLLPEFVPHSSCSAYWQGALFVQCNAGFSVMRISLSNNKYRAITMPTDIGEDEYSQAYLGRSKEGLCCASFHDWYKLRVWILDDSCGTIEWVLKHHIDVHHSVSPAWGHFENDGPWILEDANSVEHYGQQNALVNSKVEWDSDNDNIVNNESEVVQRFAGNVGVLGFHPYKDIIFLNLSLDRVLAFHLNTSMVQDLGTLCPDYYCGQAAMLTSSFLYTPCLIADLPESKLEAHVEG